MYYEIDFPEVVARKTRAVQADAGMAKLIGTVRTPRVSILSLHILTIRPPYRTHNRTKLELPS
jgi:hypothetical protein